MRFQRLSDWLCWQERLHFSQIQLGLERVQQVGAALALATPTYAVITVAGTNGKGSTTAMLEAVLRAQGYRVGAYTSPHLLRYNERIRIDGREVGDDDLCQAFDHIDRARGETPLTYFEFGTLAALWLFREAGIEAAVLEVGMGGRLDAVNYVDPDVAVLTTIGIDHVAWLGPDRERIGREKAGVLRAGCPAVYNDRDPPRSILDHARALGAQLRRLGVDYRFRAGEEHWSWEGLGRRYEGLPLPALPGAIQLQNAAGALAALVLAGGRLPVSAEAVHRGLRSATLPGRFEVLGGRVTRIFDVAHNPQAAEVLAGMLRARPCQGRTLAVFSMLADKDIEGVAAVTADVFHGWYVAAVGAERAASCERMVAALAAAGACAVQPYGDLATAYRQALAESRDGDRVVVFGSFYTVAQASALDL